MMKSLEHKIPPPAVALLICIVMAATAWFSPDSIHPTQTHYMLAALVFIVGGLFGFPAFKAFARANTTINPVNIDRASALVTGGIYRITRNPMYVGLTLLTLTVALGLGNHWFFLGPLVFVLFITRFQILPEERVMRAKFGAEYEDYRKRVRRWI